MKKRILTCIFIIIVFMLNIYVVSNIWTPTSKTYYITENIIASIDEPTINVVKEMQSEYNNTDIKAVLSINNTDYNSLVMQSSDNKYYLYRDANKRHDGLGTPFVDYRIDLSNTKKTLIFGHNSKYKEMPFKILENYYNEDYYKEHKYLTLTLEDTIKKYEIFSVYVEYKDFDYYNLNFKNDSEWFNHITKLKNKSFYDTGVEINDSDEIIILQTCSTLKKYSKYKHKFLVIVGKLV
jgi:sortase B